MVFSVASLLIDCELVDSSSAKRAPQRLQRREAMFIESQFEVRKI
jgi:hypothetical protein